MTDKEIQINIGDTVYDTFGGMIEAQKVTAIKQTANKRIIESIGYFSENEFPDSEIGVSVFLSRKEASDFLNSTGSRVREIVSDNQFNM